MSEFNSNKASLIRVDKIMQRLHIATYQEDWEGMFRLLKILKFESYYKMDKATKEKCQEKYKKLFDKRNFWSSNKRSVPIKYEFVNLLDDFFTFLTEFMGKKGMLLTDKADDGGL